MLKAIIIDDETVTRKGLIKHIPWSKLNIELAGEASDGKEGLEIVKRVKPNIVVSDVRMPGMNGIEMAREIKKTQPDCRIIFLSAYADKEYLKAAIDISAVSYVEKPVNLIEISEAIKKASQMCLEDENRKADKDSIDTVIYDNIPFIKQNLIEKLTLSSEISSEEVNRNLDYLKIQFNDKDKFIVMVLEVKNRTEDNLEKDEYEKILNTVEKYIKDIKNITTYKDNNIVSIINYRDDSIKNLLLGICDFINTKVDKNLKLFCAVGQSEIGLKNINKSFTAAQKTLSKVFYYGYGTTVFYKENRKDIELPSDEEIQTRMSKHLSEENKDEAVKLIKKTCRELKKYDIDDVNYIKCIFFRLCVKIFREANRRGIYDSKTNYDVDEHIWEIMLNLNTIDEIESYMLEKINKSFEEIEEIRSSSRTIFEIKKFIDKNYKDENISTKTLADVVYLTPSYLSALFKKEVGKTISDYIVEVRIEKSKEYLKDNRLKLLEVALNVGYSDPNYYTKVFKKITGITPSQYREKYKQ
ncbi:response regulator transcription factor [Clostridium oryzae]|uniref:Stage 0 sporulation protein A homolog n=1 Tax=Clostridium oryzae TaxID=1450648 RepID=A0A1V4ITW3_9CLOT|nr:response regulator [Clostridium oryzae]OPJ63376.1 putative response regulatory protein [Clostridium oryzae]